MNSHTGVAVGAWRYVLSLHREVPEARPAEEGSRDNEGPHGAREPDAPHIVIDQSPESTAAATGTAVAHVLARPDSIRQRAQSAATISSAVAAALAVASLAQLTGNGPEDWGPVTVGVVVAALGLWMVSVWRFVHVVTRGRRDPPEGPGYQQLVNAYEEYSNDLRQQLKNGSPRGLGVKVARQGPREQGLRG